MKRTLIAAATLLLGTSALTAASAAQDKFDKGVKVDAKLFTAAATSKAGLESLKLVQTSEIKKDSAYSGTYAGIGGPLKEIDADTQTAMKSEAVEPDPTLLAKNEPAGAMKSQAAGTGGPAEAFSSLSDKTVIGNDPANLAKNEQAGAMKNEQAFNGAGGSGDKLASVSDKTVVGDGSDPVILAKNEQSAAMKLDQIEKGMGGPIEGDDSVDLTPRPATSHYPPCTPGPGDDRCIQLYEPGVTATGN